MLLKKSYFSPYSPSSRLQNSNQATGPIIWGSIFILLVILASFALAAAENQFDQDGFPLFEADLIARIQGHLYGELLPALSLALIVVAATARLEYLTSHIGEKRPAGYSLAVKNVSLFARHRGTVLSSGAVFFVPLSQYADHVNRPRKVFHLW